MTDHKPSYMPRLHFAVLFVVLFTLAFAAPGQPAELKRILNLCTMHYPSDDRVAWECRRLKAGETAEKLFGDYWEEALRFNRVDRRHLFGGVSIKAPKNVKDVAGFSPMPLTWPEAAGDEKFLLIDLTEQFLGAYEFGRLAFSLPLASGDRKNPTPTGMFRITAFDRWHRSSIYRIATDGPPYPMNFGLRFHINREGVGFWIHGRDVPGYPASHGCIGLYDEEMQKRYYRNPKEPLLMDARRLYEWVVPPLSDPGRYTILRNGPRLQIVGKPPV